MRRAIFESILVVALAIAISWVALANRQLPFPVAFFTCAAAAFILAFRRRGVARIVAYNVAVVFTGLALLEAVLLYKTQWEDCDTELSAPHEVLGYAPLPDRRVHCRKANVRETFYATSYTLDEFGWRISAKNAWQGGTPRACVLFFGGSFTFGQGVADHEAMPYRVAAESGEQARTYNFSYKGYGPHHMLVALEHLVEEQIACAPTHAIYQAIPDHVWRASGIGTLRYRDPEYRLDGRGGVERHGFFIDGQNRVQRWITRRSSRLITLRKLKGALRREDPHHLELFHAIVVAAKRRVEERFPKAEFHVLLWDPGAKPELIEGLIERGVETHRVSEILPGLGASYYHPYRIHREEGHPNAEAHARIAKYVAKEIIAPVR